MSFTSRNDADRFVEAAFLRHKSGDLAHAQAAYRRVLSQYPSHAAALHYLGLLAQQSGHTHEALRLLHQSIAVDPTDPRAHNHLGQLHIANSDRTAAMACFERAIALDPRHVDSLNNLANVVKLREPQRAIELYRRALAVNSDTANANYNLGNMLIEERNTHEARDLLERAVAAEPRHYRAHHSLGVISEQQGRFDEALSRYEQALRVKPGFAPSLANLFAMRDYTPDAATISAAQSLLQSANIHPDERIKLNQGLGKHFDRRGEYARAFEHFTAGKAIVRERSGPFNVLPLAEQFDRLIETFTCEFFASSRRGSDSDRPIFIVGMPRSGTTLIEQILASHPRVFGAGELPYMPRIVKSLRPDYPESMRGQEAETLRALAQEYLDGLSCETSDITSYVTDKLPMNFIHLGMIATLFPCVRIIHCRRNPLDIGLSSLIELFALDADYTTTLASFGDYYAQYARLMRHWQASLPTAMFELDYERLVRSPERQIHALLEFCGLPWDTSCLNFFMTSRSVHTPSRWQVRQPIYDESIDRWRHYAAQMEPLRRYLDVNGFLSQGVDDSGE